MIRSSNFYTKHALHKLKNGKSTRTPFELPLHCQCYSQTTNSVNITLKLPIVSIPPHKLPKQCRCPLKASKKTVILKKFQ